MNSCRTCDAVRVFRAVFVRDMAGAAKCSNPTRLFPREPTCGASDPRVPCQKRDREENRPGCGVARLHRLLGGYFRQFHRVYEERYQKRYGFWRPVIAATIEKFFACGHDDQCGRLPAADVAAGGLRLLQCSDEPVGVVMGARSRRLALERPAALQSDKYFGVYSNKSRGLRAKANADPPHDARTTRKAIGLPRPPTPGRHDQVGSSASGTSTHCDVPRAAPR